ncbi:hypothetical protein TGAM01_v204546 [Trichoderma gamsii]|uniref:Uncharacterized protein n=1 Tax=Trichoderma gamsii TaxID=398673 RepID=A0A2P4ZQH8_9HYPO|nr:hypothetical protein TGAM01_v204546 [Trichoderma gamsii]PON26536.1 hypothetical protein TGAM01_v204546 [Trichoderma gamsii]
MNADPTQTSSAGWKLGLISNQNCSFARWKRRQSTVLHAWRSYARRRRVSSVSDWNQRHPSEDDFERIPGTMSYRSRISSPVNLAD